MIKTKKIFLLLTATLILLSISTVSAANNSNVSNSNIQSVGVVSDTTAPKVTSSDPVKNAITVPVNKTIRITFNEPVKFGSSPWIELKNSLGIAVPFTKAISNNNLYVKPTKSLNKGTIYTMVIHSNAITDLTGNSLPLYSTSFSTVNMPTVIIGSNSKGSVQRIGPFGTGTNKVAVIIGVHPQEGPVHMAMLNALYAMSSSLTNVKIYVYKVIVNPQYTSDYTISRATGQDLAKQYVVPRIDSTYKLAIDTHGNRGYYYLNKTLQADFIFAPSNGALSKSYANKIINNSSGVLKYYAVPEGTSPKYVTLPIASKGIPAVVLELYRNIPNYKIALYNKCVKILLGLNKEFV